MQKKNKKQETIWNIDISYTKSYLAIELTGFLVTTNMYTYVRTKYKNGPFVQEM